VDPVELGDIAVVEDLEDIEVLTGVMDLMDMGGLTGTTGLEDLENLTGVPGLEVIGDRIETETMSGTEDLEGSCPDWLSAAS
jgi:hypothetical protein